MIRKFRLELSEYDFDRKAWGKLPGHTFEFTIMLQDDSDALWLSIEDHIVTVLEEKKERYEGRKTRQ